MSSGSNSSSSLGHILVIPFYGQGHIFPSTELSKLLFSLSFKITLIIPSSLSSFTPSSTLFQITQLTPHDPNSDPLHHQLHHLDQTMIQPFTDLLTHLSNGPDPPTCAIIDVMLTWPTQPCHQFNIPTISFFTSGASSTAIRHSLWKLGLDNLPPGKTRRLPGLPDDIHVSRADFDHVGLPPRPPHGHHPYGFPPPSPPPRAPDDRPRWLSHVAGSIASLFNTCNDLERPFVEYIAKEIDKPVLGVGPLLPDQFWRSITESDSLVHDRDTRSKHDSDVSEEQLKDWLESKPRGSVIFIAFGTEVGPTLDELTELALALEESNKPFIWAIPIGAGRPFGGPMGIAGPTQDEPQPSSNFLPHDFEKRVEGRGLIIRGWAPQLLILSHRSTAGFLSHCGWNSTVEALARGVPLLAWPIRGDQHFNTKLVADHLKVGFVIKLDTSPSNPVKKEDVLHGIEKLVCDEAIRKQANSIRSIFKHGFPVCSMESLCAFRDFILSDQKCRLNAKKV